MCQPVGYCSFPDPACTSGQRYGELAGPLADQCVAAPPPPPSRCPADYLVLAGGSPGHVYQRAPAVSAWAYQANFCGTTASRAYLAIPDDVLELMSLHSLANGSFWIGINDQVTEGTFIDVTGRAATFLPWGAGQPDNAAPGEDCVAGQSATLLDMDCNANFVAICECED
jgi:hypothetical protein